MLISATIAASISFSISRLFKRNIVDFVTKIYDRKERKYDLEYVSSLIENYGTAYIAYIRNTPVIPFPLVNYISGTTSIKFHQYFIGNILGLIPSLLLAVYFYTSVINITNDIKGVIIASILKGVQILVVFYLFKKKFK